MDPLRWRPDAAVNTRLAAIALGMLENIKGRAFWIVSRICFAVYRRFPVFGPLRAAIAIIRNSRSAQYLVISRNDGRGVSFPGGLLRPGEAEETGLRREVREETGWQVSAVQFKLSYYSSIEVPCHLSVFEVQASGDLEGSWEGTPQWMSLPEIAARIVPSQRPILELLQKT